MWLAAVLVCVSLVFECCLAFVPLLRATATYHYLLMAGSDLTLEDTKTALKGVGYGHWMMIDW